METTKKVEVQVLNAFISEENGGNPAGVVLNADGLTKEEKLKIAARLGLSETAFVSKSKFADFKLDFFTPTKQIPHCGHATVAAFSYLKQLGIINSIDSSKETIDGIRKIKLDGELAFMEQLAPSYLDVSHKKSLILESLNLEEINLQKNGLLSVVNTGNSFLIVPLINCEALKRIKPNLQLINNLSEELDLIGFYVFSKEESNVNIDVNARMFAPRYGIKEEAGTGMAAGPLASYLYDVLKIKKTNFNIGQGHFMEIPSPSLIKVRLILKNNKITGLMAGGKGSLKEKVMIDF